MRTVAMQDAISSRVVAGELHSQIAEVCQKEHAPLTLSRHVNSSDCLVL